MSNTNIISPSRLEAFSNCPLKYRLDQIKGIKEETVAMRLGSINHKIIEKVFTGQKMTEKEEKQAKHLLEGIVDRLGLLKGGKIFIEDKFLISFGSSNLHGIKDFVQRTKTMANIIDWKTGKRFFTREDIDNSLQGMVYAYDEFMRNPEIEVVFFKLAMTEHNAVILKEYYREQLSDIEQEINFYVEKFKLSYKYDDFKATPSSICGWCEHIGRCPHNLLNHNTTEEINSDEAFSDAVKQYIVTERMLKEIKPVLENYINKKLDQNIDKVKDIYFSRKQTVSERVSTSKNSKEILEKNKEKIGTKVEASITRLRKFKKDDEKFYQELVDNGVIIQTPITKISWEVKDENLPQGATKSEEVGKGGDS